MAPNVKQINQLASSLADLELVQPKYLPLTHPSEEQSSQAQETVSTAPVADSASYWDWPADVTASEQEEAQQQEPTKDLFSAATLEANLIQDSQREKSETVIYASQDAAENDDYWCERAPVETNKPQHDAYWSWPAEPTKAVIQAILEDEKTRQLLSSDRIVQNLVRSRLAAAKSHTQASNDDYWNWEAPPSDRLDQVYSRTYWEWKSDAPAESLDKAQLLRAILDSEACRQMVSLTRLEENLKATPLPETCGGQASSDAYWSWTSSAIEREEEGYWDWSAKPAVTTGKGYWDW